MGGKRLGRKARHQQGSRSRYRWLMFAVLVALALVGGRWLESEYQKRRAEDTINRVMDFMSTRHVDQAYQLFSVETKKQLSRDDLARLVLDPESYHNFTYYEPDTVRTDRYEIYSRETGNPQYPTLRLVAMRGKIGYQGGKVGKYQAELELEPGGWRVNTLQIDPPAGKRRVEPEPASASPSPPDPAKTGSGSDGSPPKAP